MDRSPTHHDDRARLARTLCIAIGVGSLVATVAVGLLLRRGIFYDERFHLPTVAILDRYGFTLRFLLELPNAPGPLYTVVHWLAAPITRVQPPLVRFVNPILVVAMLLLLHRWLVREGSRAPAVAALSFAAVPMAWVITGIALTEIPAMVFVVASYLVLRHALEREGRRRALLAAAAGLLLAIAILGRQPFLVLALAAPILALGRRENVLPVALYGVLSVAPAIALFALWKGTVPPKCVDCKVFHTVHYSIPHGLLSYAYGALIVLILAPRYLRVGLRAAVLAFGLGLAAIAFGLGPLRTPLSGVVTRLFPELVVAAYSVVVSAAILSLGFLLVLAILRHTWEKRSDRWHAFLAASSLLLLTTPAAITHEYSSRYTAMAIPLLIVLVDDDTDTTLQKAARLAIGAAIGCISLVSYFKVS